MDSVNRIANQIVSTNFYDKYPHTGSKEYISDNINVKVTQFYNDYDLSSEYRCKIYTLSGLYNQPTTIH